MNKKKIARRALFTSVISLILCCAMLMGTTFAWFTDSVSTSNNLITAGNLDVELEYYVGGDWNSEDSWETVGATTNVFEENTLWEPGHTEVVYLKVSNKGSLALKYSLGVNIASETGSINVAGEEFKVSDYLKVGAIEDVTSAYASREAARADVLENSNPLTYGYAKVGALYSTTDANAKTPSEEYVALVVYMPEETGNAANHKINEAVPTINLGIILNATQQTNENDSFDNRYDGEAFVPVADVDALGEKIVTLIDDSTLKLEAAYSFKTTEDKVAAAASGYRYWHADFVVSVDKTVKAGSMALAGYYEAYAEATNTVDKWIALTSDVDITPDDKIRLMEYMGVTGNYEELCSWIPEFLCGVVDLDGSNEGTTLTVELRLYETTIYSGDESGSANIETGEYKTIGVFNHTIGSKYDTRDDGTVLYENSDGSVILYDTQDVEATEYAVPAGVTHLGNYSMFYNDTIETVTLPTSVTDLGRAFDSNATIKKVVLNEGLTTISSRAFRSTAALEEVVISSTVTTIADNAFQKSYIKEITIPATVETIGETAFGASKIETVTIEGNTSIQGYAFRGCPNLRTVYLNGDDVTFIASTLNGRNSMWFCNGESNNPNTSNITFHVVNETVAARVKTAMGAEANNTYVYVNGVLYEG